MKNFYLAKGNLTHSRFVPKRTFFHNKQQMLLLNIKTLTESDSLPWPLSYNSRGLLSISDQTFLDSSNEALTILPSNQKPTPNAPKTTSVATPN